MLITIVSLWGTLNMFKWKQIFSGMNSLISIFGAHVICNSKFIPNRKLIYDLMNGKEAQFQAVSAVHFVPNIHSCF